MAGGFTTVVDLGLEPIPGWNPDIFLPPCFWFVLTGGHNGTCIRMDSIGDCLELDATALRWLLQFSNSSAIWAIDCSSDPIVQYCSNWQNQLPSSRPPALMCQWFVFNFQNLPPFLRFKKAPYPQGCAVFPAPSTSMVDPPFQTNPSSNLPGLDTFWNRFETPSSNLNF